MGKFILVGADVHDESILVKVAVDRGAMEKRVWGNDRGGRRRMVEDLEQRAKQAGAGGIWLVYEASGQGFGLYDELSEAGIRCAVLAPTRIRKSAQERKQKNDEKDAERLLEILRGHVLAGNRLPAVWIPDGQTRDDRELVRARLELGEKISEVKTQVKSLLKRNAVRRGQNTGRGWSCEYRMWLDYLVKEEGGGLGRGAGAALGVLVTQLEFLESEEEKLDGAIAELAKAERYAGSVAEMRKLKGVGLLTAMVYLTEMGDLTRFRNRRQVGAYIGLAPCMVESGEASDRKGHITHEGPARVRKVLCQATWARVRHDQGEQQFYARVARKNPKHRKKAVVAVMRRLAVRMWHAGLRGKQVAG